VDTVTLPDRIQTKFDVDAAGCWLWTAARDGSGYGHVRWQGKLVKAHRIVYELLVGPITEETLDHLCRVWHCVNPDHLEPVSRRENTLRGDTMAAKHAATTHCPAGHPYSGANVYYKPGNGARECVTCREDRWRRRYYGKKQAPKPRTARPLEVL
jgi:hypothetical protein